MVYGVKISPKVTPNNYSSDISTLLAQSACQMKANMIKCAIMNAF